MFGFVYLWFDRKHKRYYIGSHWGSPDDGYICSSKWMLQSYKNRPQDFKRRILSLITTNKKDMLFEEQRWLYMIPDNQLGKKYYNLRKTTQFYWWTNDNIKLTTSQKISRALTGKPRLDLAKMYKGRTKETHEYIANSAKKMKGRTKETHAYIASISEKNKGRLHSPEEKLKRGQAVKKHIQSLSPEEQKTRLQKSMWNCDHKLRIQKGATTRIGKLRGPLSEEHKEKLRITSTGRPCSEQSKLKIADKNSLTYLITFPNGEEKQIKNLTQFCLKHDLYVSNLCRGSSKGYKARMIKQE